MRPIENLMSEHRVIETVLDCLERMADRAERDGQLDRASADQALEFLRLFADRCHHGKEEDVLFARMVERGMPKDGGPIAVMLHEHGQGRALISAMAAAAAAGGAAAFVGPARDYAALLRAHIQKEDHILYPMAEQVLDDADQADLERRFDKVEATLPAGTHERMLAAARELAGRFGVAFAGPTGHH
jgi:hemerythrin-like domain-containing protein